MPDFKRHLINFFTQPRLPARAISLRSRRLSAASVSLRKGQLVLNRAAVEPLPEGIIEPHFGEPNIKNRERLVSTLRHMLERAGLLGSRRWSLAIPRKATQTFIIQLDQVPKRKKELIEILEWKAERLLETPLEDITVAFQRLQPVNGSARFLAVAGLTQVLDSYEGVLEELGLRAGFVIPSHLAETAWLSLWRMADGRWRIGKQALDEPRLQSAIGHRPSAIGSDALLMTADPTEVTIIFVRANDIVSVRSVEYKPDTLPDEVHRSLVYYLDKLAPDGDAEARLGLVLLIGEALDPIQVDRFCQELFPADRLPRVHALRENKIDGLDSINLEMLATAAGLAALGT
jgi:hypothetical protein